MNTMAWLLALALLGLATGKIVGAGIAFTGGRSRTDLLAGLLGAFIVAIPLRLSGLRGYSDALPTLIMGVSAAMLATWVTRMLTWKAEPVLRPETETAHEVESRRPHDTMTTSDGTRILLRARRLVVPGLTDQATQPPARA